MRLPVTLEAMPTLNTAVTRSNELPSPVFDKMKNTWSAASKTFKTTGTHGSSPQEFPSHYINNEKRIVK